MTDSRMSELRESVELEHRSDLCAAGGNLREATYLMREANALRAKHFGKLDPNELRERTMAALRARASQ